MNTLMQINSTNNESLYVTDSCLHLVDYCTNLIEDLLIDNVLTTDDRFELINFTAYQQTRYIRDSTIDY